MTFGEALTYIKDGHKVARTGWNGKRMWITLASGGTHSLGHLEPFIVMKTADYKLVPWLASQTDILASDWYLT